MENIQNMQPITPEIVWATIQATNLQMQETDRRIQETDRQMQETNRRMQETDRQMQETDRKLQETDRLIRESRTDFADFDRRMKELQKTVGGWAYNHGTFAEDYFFNSFEKGRTNFFGEKFDKIERNVHIVDQTAKKIDEYDILLINGTSIGIIEVKHKANKNHIPKILRKAETFRINFPDYKNHKVYLGFASYAFYPEVEEECNKYGIAIIKQAGNTMVMNEEKIIPY